MISSHFFPADAEQRPHSTQPQTPDRIKVTSPPWLLDMLFRNLSYDLEQVANVIDPILTAQNHCYRTSWYVQGLVSEEKVFLSTNINPEHVIRVTLCGSRWLLGASHRCTVAMPHPGIADCHAALNFDSLQGFYISDLGSTGGTWVNGRRLTPAQPHYLQDGDLVKLGSLRFEFLQQHCNQTVWNDC
jgi:hypothetical protein